MRSSLAVLAVLGFVVFFAANVCNGDSIDLKDPRRAVAREDDLRIDAELTTDVISNNSVGVTYQIENLSRDSVAVADKVVDSSFDAETRTITVSIGTEVPIDGSIPHMVIIGPGEKKVLRCGLLVNVNIPGSRSSASVPLLVRIQINVLRDLAPFATLIAGQDKDPHVRQQLTADLIDQWMQRNDPILLNSIPVHWAPKRRGAITAESRGSS